jgi:type IV pilus assembly protein PilY1
MIYTVVSNALTTFSTSSAAIAGLRTAMNVTLDVNGDGAVNSTDANTVINVVRSGGAITAGTNGFLGDIFHSSPIMVGPPSPTFVDRTFDPTYPTLLQTLAAAPDTYALFRTSRRTRPRLLAVGANDGMLHAFNAGTFNSGTGLYNTGTGSEVWGFIPPQMLPKLQNLAVNGGHQYFVDGSPRVADVWIDDNNDGVKATDGSEWHTVLIGGFRQGGTGLYALDVTDTSAAPSFLWTFATGGQSWSEPAFGKVKIQTSQGPVDRWVVFVGDGYDPAGSSGRLVHVIDIKTGKDLWQFPTTASVASGPIIIDMNGDGYVDRVYVGTVGGDLLRLDVSALGRSTAAGGNVDPATNVMVATCASVPTSSSTCWYGGTFFSAGAGQPFFTKMAATTDPHGNLWLFAGSGDRTNPLLVPTTPNRSYGIKDGYPSASSTLTEAALTDVTSINGGYGSLDPSTITNSGWFFAFRSGEKEWAEVALVFNQQVFFTTFMPSSTTCGDVGSGSIYMVYYLTGGGVSDTALFTADPPVASSRVYQVNAGVISRPVVTTGLQGANAHLYLGNSSGLTITPTFSAPTSIRSTRYWRRVLP